MRAWNLRTMPSVQLGGLRKTHWYEHLVRFVFGGLVTVATGLVAKHYGPDVGGLFLAFPAILPASLTLVKQHHGRHDAAQAAAGSRLGALSLIGFGGAVTMLAEKGALVSLCVATIVWACLSLLLWQLAYGEYSQRNRSSAERPGFPEAPSAGQEGAQPGDQA